VVVLVVMVVVVLVVVDVLLLTTCEGSLPATVLALTAPAATSATNRAPVKTFFIPTFCLIPTPYRNTSTRDVTVISLTQTRPGCLLGDT
jgi:hypothetical protein